jgi:hypothetical protein
MHGGNLKLITEAVWRYISFVRISQLIWIGHVNRMDSKRKVEYLTTVLREVN